MKLQDDKCLPLFLFLDASVPTAAAKAAHRHAVWQRKKSRTKQQSVEVVSVSLSNVLNIAFLAVRSRLPLLLLACTVLAVGCLVTLASFRAVTKALPFSLVFSAPIHDNFLRKPSQDLPQRIPRIIHQTARSFDTLPDPVPSLRESWRKFNPDWDIEQWDDARCREFVRKEFPEYFTAYQGLPKNVERADFFRYMVVLRYGGVYADIDTECKQPLQQFIRPRDTLIVGWEGEVGDHDALMHRHFARYRQVQQWFFAAAPGHPALRRVCDHVAASYEERFSEYTNIDTLERTGPGAWTDAVLETALQHSPGSDDQWPTRFLPQVATGVHKVKDSTPGLSMETVGILVQHHFIGTWKDRKGFPKTSVFQKIRRLIAGPEPVSLHPTPSVPRAPARDPTTTLYPVSINHHGTVFTMMVNLIGHGDLQSHEDPSAMLTRFGNWQAGMGNTLQPRAPVALAGSLGKAPQEGGGPVLLDIGAGIGFYSVTAAMRGHRVIATELSPASLDALHASVAENGMHGLVTVKNVTVGASRRRACLQPAFSGWSLQAAGWRPEEIARGYGPPALHDRTSSGDCARAVKRSVMEDLVPEGVRVGAVRVSAGAWTAEVLKGGLPMLKKHLPAALLLEVDMAEMSRVRGVEFGDIVMQLHRMGYQNMGHAGSVCLQRFEVMMAALQKGGEETLQTHIDDLRQPSWCDLDPTNLAIVLEQNRRNGLEKQEAIDAPGVELFFLQFNGTVSVPQ